MSIIAAHILQVRVLTQTFMPLAELRAGWLSRALVRLSSCCARNILMPVLLAFFLYDSILTLSREAKVFWTRQLSSAKVLYFVIRYSTLLYQILDTLEPATILTTTVRIPRAQFCLKSILKFPKRYLQFSQATSRTDTSVSCVAAFDCSRQAQSYKH